MARFVLTIGNSQSNFDIELFKESLVEISSKEKIQIKSEGGSSLIFTYLTDEPLKGQRYFSDENWTVFLAGELIDYESVPYKEIIEIIDTQNFNELKKLNGVFAIIVYNKIVKKYYIISDRRSQYPIYYYLENETLIISSELSAFCRILNTAEFNEKWLYDYMFFHYPIGDETFLKNVKRLPHSSLLVYCNMTRELSLKKYCGLFERKENLYSGKEGLEYAKEVFSKRVPKYFEGSDNVACALTGGWDGRTNVALAPDRNNITTYTYGGKDCNDFIFSRKAVRDIKTNHFEITFDDEFVKNLNDQMLETVYLSSGTQPILRSSLLNVYSRLSDFPIVVSGISYDGLFRGNIGGPSIVSTHIIEAFKKGNSKIDTSVDSNDFIDVNGEYNNEIKIKLSLIENEFGDFQSSENHLLFANYVCDPQNFLGEYKLAELFTTLRVPAWDYEIIDLAFSIEQSTLTFSEFVYNKRGAKETMVLQSYLISQFAPELMKTPVKMVSPKSVLKGDFAFSAYSKYRKLIYEIDKMLFLRDQKPLEDWNNWLNVNHKTFVDDLIFSKEALIQNYYSQEFLNRIKTQRNYRTIGKLCTTEIILKLINNKWRRFW